MGAAGIQREQHSATLRVEDAALLRGAGRFSDDLRLDGMVWGVFVRSTHAHARISRVAIDAARRHPGVVAVLTAADMRAAGVGSLSRPPAQSGRGGQPLIVPHRPALADERVVHVGEPIALVVAETAAAAGDAAELVVVDYEPLPSVCIAEAALASGAPPVWPEAPDNLALDWPGPSTDSDQGDRINQILAEAAHVVSARVVNQRLAGVPLETRGATAVYDPANSHFTLYAPSQSAHVLKAQMCGILSLAPDHLRVLSGDVGGAFGLKTPPYPEYVALLVAAKMLGRPIHWMATRSEAFLSDHQGRDNVTESTLALDHDGRFLALQVSAVTNLGAYVTSAGAVIATIGFANCFPGMYDIPDVSIRVRLAFTNTVPTGPYRGAGRPEANYVMERLIDAAAHQIGIDPIDLRRRNLIPADALPYRSALGNVYDSGDFDAVLSKAVTLAGLGEFAKRRNQSLQRGRLRGIGVSCFLEHAGGGPTEGAVLAIDDDKVVVRLGMHPSGQGHATVFRNLVASRLGIRGDQVVVEQGDSDLPIRGGPSVGSRSTNAAGTALVDGVTRLVDRAGQLAADPLAANPADIAYRDGYLEVVGTNHRISLFDLAKRLPQANALTTIAQVDAFTTFPNGCHIAEVEVDPETGKVFLVGYVAVDDCGVVLDHTLAEAQIVGGLAQGFGQALFESIVYDDAGQLLTGSLMDYAIPRAADMPPITSVFHPVPCRSNPLGVKGIGEAGSTAAIAAVMNAIADAIPDRAGAEIDMPATPEKVWRACAQTRKDESQPNKPDS